MDDGRVEIMYGATSRREIYKYGGPAASKFRQLPAQSAAYSPPVVSTMNSGKAAESVE
jgi:hypothetical protein